MPTRTIPQDEWKDFLNSFTHEQRLELVTVRVSDPELGYQVEMRQLPLLGVTPDLRAGGEPRVEVMVGRTDFDHTTHSISRPMAIRLKESDQGEAEVLELESKDGSKTLVILRPVAYGEPGPLIETS